MSPVPSVYDVCEAKSVDQLCSEVTRMMREGWVPIGGIAVRVVTVTSTFYQAMVKS